MIVKIVVEVLCMLLLDVSLNLQGSYGNQSTQRTMRPTVSLTRRTTTQRAKPTTVLHDVLLTGRTTTQRANPTTVLHDVLLTGRTTTQRAKPTTVLHDVLLTGRTTTQRAKPTTVLHDVLLTGKTTTQRAKPTTVLHDVLLTGKTTTQRAKPTTVLHDVLLTGRTTTQRANPTTVLHDVLLTGRTTTQRAKPTTVLHDVLLTGRTTTQRAKPTTVLHDVLLTGRTTTQRAKPTTVLHDVMLTGRTTTQRANPTTVLHDVLLTGRTTTQRANPTTVLHDVLLTGRTTTQRANPTTVTTVLQDVLLTGRTTTQRAKPTTVLHDVLLTGRTTTQRAKPTTVLQDVLLTGRTTTQRAKPTTVLQDVLLTGRTTTQRAKPTTVLQDVLLTGRTTTQRAKPTTVLQDVLLTGRTTTQRAKPTTVLHDVLLTGRATTRRTIRRPTTTIPDTKLRNGLHSSPSHGPGEDYVHGSIHSTGEREAELSITTTLTLQEAAMNLSMFSPFDNLTEHGVYDHLSLVGYWNEDYLHVLYEHCARRIGWKKCLGNLPVVYSTQSMCVLIRDNRTINDSVTTQISIQKYPYIFDYFDYYNLDIHDLSCKEDYTGSSMADYEHIDMYITYVIGSLGLLGNGLSIITIYMADNELTSTSIYLIALAISDSVYLIGKIAIFEQLEIVMREEIGYELLSSISAWLLVVITVERFKSIYNPFTVHDHCYPRSAKMYVAIVSSICCAIYTIMYFEGVYDQIYGSLKEYEDAYRKIVVTLFVLVFVGPFLIILTLNIAIICILYKAAKQRQNISKSDWDKEIKITRTLVIVTTSYLVLIGPFYTIMMIQQLIDWNYTPYEMSKSKRISNISQYMETLKTLNYCINFLIYTLCGSKYRESFLTLLTRTRCKHHTHVV